MILPRASQAVQKLFQYAVPMGVEDQEDQLFQQDVDVVKQWWQDPRWRHTKRPFTAEQIVAKRGNLKIQYPSNDQSKKLWSIIEGRFTASHRSQHIRILSLIECRTGMLASHMDASSQRCLRKWRSISTLFTSLAGSAPRRLPPQTNPRPTLLIIHT